MDQFIFWVLLVLVLIVLQRLLSRRATTTKARVAAMLRRYYTLERSGLSEQECMVTLLATRSGWKNLPQRFLVDLVARLGSKEDVMRFVLLSEDYGYCRGHYPAIAAEPNAATAIAEVACLLAKFGYQLQGAGRLKEAEFVQRLARRLEPNKYFTNLPLAVTYCETGRYADALPLFEQGLSQFENDAQRDQEFSPVKCLAPNADAAALQRGYRKMYESCLRATKGKTLSNVSLVTLLDCFF